MKLDASLRITLMLSDSEFDVLLKHEELILSAATVAELGIADKVIIKREIL